MYSFILPLVIFVPLDSNVAVDMQVWFPSSKWISSVAGIFKILVRLKLLAQLIHMWECKTFAVGHKVFVRGVMKDWKMCGFNWQKLHMIIYAKLQSSRVRHQYGIFGGKSQTSFMRNATRAGSKEGRLFSQAKVILFWSLFTVISELFSAIKNWSKMIKVFMLDSTTTALC